MDATKRESRRLEEKRYQDVMAAAADERSRVNQAIKAGKRIIVHTFCGDYILDQVTPDFWYITHPAAQKTEYDSFSERSWAGCNDGEWEKIMRQAGMGRNPLFLR